MSTGCQRLTTVLKPFKKSKFSFVKMKHTIVASNTGATPARKRHWREGLLETMENPESIVKEDDQVTVIKDKYPKSRHHYLVLPKDDIHSIKKLTKEHENLLTHMEKIGQEVADQHQDYEFILGYHAVPSMARLHLHVISTDFDSPCLKNKYHWNSFTTPFFRPSQSIREELRDLGYIKQMSSSESEKYLKKDLICHKCSYRPKNLPDLKKHLVEHINVN
ncbi:aprataxin [Venturia canescens]|uniref:aprataxin n=1 Tax=Venturia canescens TaxID=32260 RepID=UPI001C9D53B5|nr:aprataxin [Venturia canescens]